MFFQEHSYVIKRYLYKKLENVNHSYDLQTDIDAHIVGFQAHEKPRRGKVPETERGAVVSGTGVRE